jgi:peptidoglycan/xylan/chitin deacetylase (PgdA/CDA1 family)
MKEKGFYTLLFHALFKDSECQNGNHPYLFVRLGEFEQCIKLLKEQGFSFLDPQEMAISNDHQRNILLTFDDGYFNNHYVLDCLEKYKIKALFFFVEYQILHQQLFWWDVYYQNRIKQVPFSVIYQEMQDFKQLNRTQIEERIKRQFSRESFDADDDSNRPMTVDELKKFAQHPLVDIGAHSASHEILTNCSQDHAHQEMLSCKDFLRHTIGREVSFISYPHGMVNSEIIKMAKVVGFQWGMTTIPGLNRWHELNSFQKRLSLRRNAFPLPGDKRSVVQQIEEFIQQTC